MLLPPFALHRPTDLPEAVGLLDAHADEGAVVYMGGTELLLVMKLGLSQPEHLVDCKRLPELQGIAITDAEVRIGAGTTHRQIERHPVLWEILPALPRMAQGVANVRVRNAGTLGGNLCFAEPHSDPAALLIALGAEVDLMSPRGPRSVPLDAFFLGSMMTVLEEDEIMVRVRFPRPDRDTRSEYRRLAFRERPVVTVGAKADGRLRLTVGAVGSRPLLVDDGELEVPTSDRAIRAIAERAGEAVVPIPDADGSADYKRHLTRVVVARTLRAMDRS